MSNSVIELSSMYITRQNAKRFLADKAYLYVMGKAQAAKLRQVMKAVDIDGLNMRFMRDVLAEDSRFECVDRRWTTTFRLGDNRRPVERVLGDVLTAAGSPQLVDVLAEELAQIYSRATEHFASALPKMFADKNKYFSTEDDRYGLTSWLIMTSTDVEDDIIFDSFMSDEQVAEFTQLCPAKEWNVDSFADTAVAIVTECGQAVPLKILALFAWRSLGLIFDAVDFYTAVISDARLVLLSDQKLYPASVVADWNKEIIAMSEDVAALPVEAEEDEAEGPISITETDKEEIINMILSRDGASAQELLEAVLEIGPEESAYAGALDSLREAIGEDDRIMSLGSDRWSKVIVFPDEVQMIPDSLVVPEVPAFETPEGDVYDQELEIDGFEGDLKSGVYNPLSEDVTDEDPSLTNYQPNGDSQRCVLKYHHKTQGTFPLCQISPDFFGTSPEIIPITLIDDGKRKQVFVNNTTRLMYGLKDFYKDITQVSGAVFHIEKTAKPGEYRFRFDDETDEQLGVDIERSLELLDLKARYESQPMPIFDVITEILEHNKKGVTFPQLVNEVNIVRRCSRMLVASVLSSYHTFHTRGKSGLWQYDEKKRSQGFDKTKRKYVKK